MSSYRHDVRVSHEDDSDWLVWLGSTVVGRFISALDALALASLLECSPRARLNALVQR